MFSERYNNSFLTLYLQYKGKPMRLGTVEKAEGEKRLKLAEEKIREWSQGKDATNHPSYNWVRDELERLKIRCVVAPDALRSSGTNDDVTKKYSVYVSKNNNYLHKQLLHITVNLSSSICNLKYRELKTYIYLGAFTREQGVMRRKEAREFIERIIREKNTTPTVTWMRNALERERFRDAKAEHNSLKRNFDKTNEDGVSNGTGDDHDRAAKKKRVMVDKEEDGTLGSTCPIDTNGSDHDRPVKKKKKNVDKIDIKSNDDFSMKKKRVIEDIKTMSTNGISHDLLGDVKKLKDDGQNEVKQSNDNQNVRENNIPNRDSVYDDSDIKSSKARDNRNNDTNEVEKETNIGKKMMKIEEDGQNEQNDMNSRIVSLLIFLNMCV